MFTRNVFAGLVSTVCVVSTSIFVMQLLLFGQEGGEECVPGDLEVIETSDDSYAESGGIKVKYVHTAKTETRCDADCDYVPHECECITWTNGPKTRTTVTGKLYELVNGAYVHLPEKDTCTIVSGNDSYLECGD